MKLSVFLLIFFADVFSVVLDRLLLMCQINSIRTLLLSQHHSIVRSNTTRSSRLASTVA